MSFVRFEIGVSTPTADKDAPSEIFFGMLLKSPISEELHAKERTRQPTQSLASQVVRQIADAVIKTHNGYGYGYGFKLGLHRSPTSLPLV